MGTNGTEIFFKKTQEIWELFSWKFWKFQGEKSNGLENPSI